MLGKRALRVQIRVSSKDKHKLPVHATCKWYHNNGIAKYYEGCWSVGDRPVETFDDIRLCMVEANCDIYGALKPLKSCSQ